MSQHGGARKLRATAIERRRGCILDGELDRIRLEPDRIYIKDGAVWTSAGITAGIDLALALIAEDLGDAIARRTAQQLVVYYRRPASASARSTDARAIGW